MDAQLHQVSDQRDRNLDRLAALENVISRDCVQQAISDAGLVQKRSCRLTHDVMVWIALAMGIFTESSIRDVFRFCERFGGALRIPSRSALSRARKRLGIEPIRRLFLHVVSLLCQPLSGHGYYKGYRLMGMDGTVLTVPDTVANREAFGKPKGGSCSTSEGGFPQVRKVSLVELGSHVEYRFVTGKLKVGEPTMAKELVEHIEPQMLLLLDAGFFGYPLLKAIFGKGGMFLANVSSTPRLEPIKVLSDGSYLTRLYPHGKRRKVIEEGVLVRIIAYTLDDPQRTGHGKIHRLATSLLDENEYSSRELISLYHERWEQEITYDEQKTHLIPRRPSKPTHLRSESPVGIMQELFAYSLAHFVTRKIIWDAACEAKIDPDRISFTATVRTLQARMPECANSSPTVLMRWYANLLREIGDARTERRRNRVNPRVIKRARCKWPVKKKEHYRQPKLAKTFEQTIVLT